MDSKKIILYLAIKYSGNWDRIYEFFSQNKQISETEALDTINKYKGKSKYITIFDEEYPETLKMITKPPFVLFYHGDISLIDCKFKSIAVVGSRRCSDYGAKNTVELVSKLSKELTIISGMAMGIDSIAHNVALNNKGKTIAVLGSGINYVYPSFNKSLYEKIKKNGLILSEYPDEVPPNPRNFPIRNRIVAGLTNICLIPEGKNNSGSSITATLVLNYGGDICVCPEQRGKDSLCNKLISYGARLVETVEDIYDEMNYQIHEPIFK